MLRPLLLVLTCLVATSACDREVLKGQELVLTNRELVLGAENENAVIVRPEGSLVVEDADVIGRGGPFPDAMNPSPGSPIRTGAAIVSTGGSVRIVQGLVAGGSVVQVADVDNGILEQAQLGSGILGSSSSVAIEGGTVRSGGIILAEGVSNPSVTGTAAAVSVNDSELRISGGTLVPGEQQGIATLPDTSLFALRSNVEISGGDLSAGAVSLIASTSRITGGQLGDLFTGAEFISLNPFQVNPGCTEIHGGSLQRVAVLDPGQRLILFGTNFNRLLGPIPTPPATGAPSAATISIALTGTLENGAPLDVELLLGNGTVVSLVAPGSPGCS